MRCHTFLPVTELCGTVPTQADTIRPHVTLVTSTIFRHSAGNTAQFPTATGICGAAQSRRITGKLSLHRIECKGSNAAALLVAFGAPNKAAPHLFPRAHNPAPAIPPGDTITLDGAMRVGGAVWL